MTGDKDRECWRADLGSAKLVFWCFFVIWVCDSWLVGEKTSDQDAYQIKMNPQQPKSIARCDTSRHISSGESTLRCRQHVSSAFQVTIQL